MRLLLQASFRASIVVMLNWDSLSQRQKCLRFDQISENRMVHHRLSPCDQELKESLDFRTPRARIVEAVGDPVLVIEYSRSHRCHWICRLQGDEELRFG